MNRRNFLAQMLYGTVGCLVPWTSYSFLPINEFAYFKQGVAAGDPTENAVVIWTRITSKSIYSLAVLWEVSTTADFSSKVTKGTLTTDSTKDYTVKVEIEHLQPDQIYYYRFAYQGQYSPIGQCKTLPLSINGTLTMAVVSCNNYEDGYFNSFESIALQEDIDYVIHVGDYIYEYETLGYANAAFVKQSGRMNDPLHELVTLEDYRRRFQLYRSDLQLQLLHQKKAFFCMWDDHEFANDAYKEGAKNHQKEEGDWNDRKVAALQAYFEWMPVRATTVQEMVRKLTIGTDCQLYFLEERLEGRDRQGEYTQKERHLISENQQEWLTKQLNNEAIRWHIIVNQVMFTGYDLPDKNRNQRYDWWTGYPDQRQQLIEVFKSMKNPPIILTGDHHQAHVLALKDKEEDGLIAWEFLTPSITSKNDDRMTATDLHEKYRILTEANTHLHYSNTHEHGYFVLNIKKTEVEIDYRYSTSILQQNTEEVQGPIFKITATNQLIRHV